MSKLIDLKLRAWLKNCPPDSFDMPDGAVPGLSLRVGPYSMTWTPKFGVAAEGGISKRGHQKKGTQQRVTRGEYSGSHA